MRNPLRTRAGVCPHLARRSTHLTAAAALLLMAATSCTGAEQLSCPDRPPATDLRIDASETSRSDAIRSDHLATVRSQLELIALCHGSVHVGLFSSGTGATETLLSGELAAKGATIPARRRHLDEAVDPAVAEITISWDEVEASLPADGTDVLGQLELMAEYFSQHPDHAHRGFILTDGVQTTGVVVTNDEAFTEEVAADLAERVAVPDLSGAELTIGGIGKVGAGEPPPSSYVTALKTFYRIVCERTGARCLVVTDLATS